MIHLFVRSSRLFREMFLEHVFTRWFLLSTFQVQLNYVLVGKLSYLSFKSSRLSHGTPSSKGKALIGILGSEQTEMNAVHNNIQEKAVGQCFLPIWPGFVFPRLGVFMWVEFVGSLLSRPSALISIVCITTYSLISYLGYSSINNGKITNLVFSRFRESI